MASALVFGTLVSMGVLLAGTVIVAQLINREILDVDKMAHAVPIFLIGATYLGCGTACARLGEKRLLTSALTGMIVLVLLMAVTIVFFEGRFQGIWANILLILCGCVLAALPVKERRGAVKKRKIKISTR